ncbi:MULTISPECIES: protocatechuate 3,4-dioxygenase subunit alpha [Nocardioides]|uniref:Protocatechuate 3,4-dioxygenase subunit alpha n=1 Tax=Nocardioides vastitatis TaxID=2568655 RepID=A0ABW0ZLQ0_9ACTN|nr:protocatechuate 3,4-dioxygenase subunit alpha [Nocardioides sp.]THJ04329.1 protocatechuate 3,4-dioxygenase subunit alpha [Nocardioides sp.]
MSSLPPTPGQTVGPFFHYALPYDGDNELVPPGSPGSVRLSGLVLDGSGDPVPDALIEIWQPDPAGGVVRAAGSLHRDGHTFTGFGRAATDRAGRYTFSTLRPGSVAPGRAPYFAMAVFARGLLHRLMTRCYLPGPEVADDPFLASLETSRRATLTAREDELGYVFDVRLQGEDETVFLEGRRD